MTAHPPQIGFVSLGCAKALVDSERIITALRQRGYGIAPSYDGADVVVVNTCGFLDSAKAESLQAIGEAMAENGRVVVTGCFGLAPAVRAAYPDVLAVTGPHDPDAVVAAIERAAPAPHAPFLDLVPRAGLRLTPPHYAYLKVSEGCNHRCSFCIIPQLRGDLVSRPMGDVMAEAEALVEGGCRELLVVAQDTSAYGVDLRYAASEWRGRERPARFNALCEALGSLGVWVRLHYVYPYPHVDEIIPLMATGQLLPYLDVPFQHASPSVLRAMRRPAAAERTLDRLAAWRAICPDIAVRSTFVVGFPGETEADFEMLLDWLRAARLTRVGCFAYENVEGAPARDLPGHLPEAVKTERRARLMAVAEGISAEVIAAQVGRTMDVLIDEADDYGASGRSYMDAPEIDGIVDLPGCAARPGNLVAARIIAADGHDLIGEVIQLPRVGSAAAVRSRV